MWASSGLTLLLHLSTKKTNKQIALLKIKTSNVSIFSTHLHQPTKLSVGFVLGQSEVFSVLIENNMSSTSSLLCLIRCWNSHRTAIGVSGMGTLAIRPSRTTVELR